MLILRQQQQQQIFYLIAPRDNGHRDRTSGEDEVGAEPARVGRKEDEVHEERGAEDVAKVVEKVPPPFRAVDFNAKKGHRDPGAAVEEPDVLGVTDEDVLGENDEEHRHRKEDAVRHLHHRRLAHEDLHAGVCIARHEFAHPRVHLIFHRRLHPLPHRVAHALRRRARQHSPPHLLHVRPKLCEPRSHAPLRC